MYQDNYTYPYVDKYGRGYFMDQSGYAYYVDNNGVSRYLEPMTFLNKWFYKVNHLTAAWRILIHIFITPIVVVGNISLQAAWGLIKNLPMIVWYILKGIFIVLFAVLLLDAFFSPD